MYARNKPSSLILIGSSSSVAGNVNLGSIHLLTIGNASLFSCPPSLKIPRKLNLFKRHKMASDEEMLDVSFPRQYMSLTTVGNSLTGKHVSLVFFAFFLIVSMYNVQVLFSLFQFWYLIRVHLFQNLLHKNRG